MALMLDDRAAARRYVDRYLSLRPGGEHALGARVTRLILDPAVPARHIGRVFDTIRPIVLEPVWLDFVLAPDSAEVGVTLARELAGRHVTDDVWYRDSTVRQGFL